MILLGFWEVFLGMEMEEKGENERGLERFLSLPWVSRVFLFFFISQECGVLCVGVRLEVCVLSKHELHVGQA